VGGGIGGLVTAAKLAQLGANVTICEQNPTAGGRCQTISVEGCRFDAGPSLLLLPQVCKKQEELFEGYDHLFLELHVSNYNA
jgi:phytoene dehydrogenase-like protein